jgi:hypothetical protein
VPTAGLPAPRPAPDDAAESTGPGRSTDEQPARAAAPTDEAAPADEAAGPGLSDRERAILAFERQWWRHAGAKEQAIRDTFGLSSTRYYQLLNGLLDNPAALAAEPMLVGRLRRLRSTRSRARRR